MYHKVKRLLISFAWMLALRLAYAFFVGVCAVIGLYEPSRLVNAAPLSEVYGLTTALVLMIVVAPTVEEFAFRGWMTKNRKLIALSLCFAAHFFSILTINTILPDFGGLKYAVTLLVVFTVLLLTLRGMEHVSSFLEKYEFQLKWFSIMMFSLIHATNYEFRVFDFLSLSSLLVILAYYPFSGYLLTKVRIELGLVWAIVLHSLTNSLVLIEVFTSDYLP
jgi:hypothetical protein